MNNELIEEKAQLYALGILPESEKKEFESKVREDRELQSLVHEYQRLVELEARPARAEPSFQTYSQVMEEIDGASEPHTASATGSTLVSFATWGGWAAAACAALALMISYFGAKGGVNTQSDIVLNNLANPRIIAVQTPSEDFAVEDRMLELAGLAEAYWFSREGIPAGQLLDGQEDTEVAEMSGGFTIYDRRYNIGFIAVENLPREAPNKSYHVWAKTDPSAAPVRAGTLPIGEESRGLFFFDLSTLPKGASLDSLSFFVTEEESEDPTAPSQMVVLSDV
ncbi:anti-sigma factor [Pelagicoccus sp. SDUM812002]|uniref:anti-sigma factor domain-containing protein n=1 Tax=Pelagicoccus sp. SDUM812002 TaxID=3041266 RepID=UPI00280D1D8E|nr:anti-sigma factor [Pelagicoccus sp. SDUM812002]MDQ8184699.1 anti-sigma factor [Pelagicoccus sp. SDUM812002]